VLNRGARVGMYSSGFRVQVSENVKAPRAFWGRGVRKYRTRDMANTWTYYGRGQPLSDCSLHCRLAKFRGLMRREKYGAVIGRNRLFVYVFSMNFQVMGSCKPITAPYFRLFIKSRNFAKRQCERRWLTPPNTDRQWTRRHARRL